MIMETFDRWFSYIHIDNISKGGIYMSKKKKTILISILAVALVAIIILVVVMVTKMAKG